MHFLLGESGTADSPFVEDTLAGMLRRLGREGEDEALPPEAKDAVLAYIRTQFSSKSAFQLM